MLNQVSLYVKIKYVGKTRKIAIITFEIDLATFGVDETFETHNKSALKFNSSILDTFLDKKFVNFTVH